jgi:hypothetical protein
MRTGTLTRPKEIVPVQIDRIGIEYPILVRGNGEKTVDTVDGLAQNRLG